MSRTLDKRARDVVHTVYGLRVRTFLEFGEESSWREAYLNGSAEEMACTNGSMVYAALDHFLAGRYDLLDVLMDQACDF
jgi:hypothetical protein